MTFIMIILPTKVSICKIDKGRCYRGQMDGTMWYENFNWNLELYFSQPPLHHHFFDRVVSREYLISDFNPSQGKVTSSGGKR